MDKWGGRVLEFGYVRLYRSLLNWEWYTDSNTKDVFIHLILTANYEPKKWKGITVERGQRIYSAQKLADELHVSRQTIRTAISHLLSTGEITNCSTSKYSIITIKNYDSYQQLTNQSPEIQQSSNQPTTNEQPQCNKDKESNKAINKKNIYSEIFLVYSKEDAELLKALNDFAEMRKSIKKPFTTERAVKMLLEKLDKLAQDNKTKILILNKSIFQNWQGVFPLKGDDENVGRAANGNSEPRAGEHTPKVPKYGEVL
jgi:biotin operon repressor